MTDQPDPGCPSTGQHGTERAYNHHRCRCPAARAEAHRRRINRRVRQTRPGVHPAVVDAADTRARIEELLAAGWTPQQLTRELGDPHSSVVPYRNRIRLVLQVTAARVAALPSTPPPPPAPPPPPPPAPVTDEWDDYDWEEPAEPDTEPDQVVLARLFGGGPSPVPLAVVDMAAFAVEAAARGWSVRRTRERLGVSWAEVRRWRAGPPDLRDCAWCNLPIPFDVAGGERPWEYRKRQHHRECFGPARSAMARRQAATAAAARASGLAVAS